MKVSATHNRNNNSSSSSLVVEEEEEEEEEATRVGVDMIIANTNTASFSSASAANDHVAAAPTVVEQQKPKSKSKQLRIITIVAVGFAAGALGIVFLAGSQSNIRSSIHELVFNKDASFSDLFTIACAWAVVWAVIFPLVESLLQPFLLRQRWLRDGSERALEREGGVEALNDLFKTNLTREEMVDKLMKEWLPLQLLTFQHLICGLLCIPSLVGMGDPSWASSVVAIGILCEVGFEMYDSVKISYKRIKYGKGVISDFDLFGAMVHHSFALVLCIPAILRFREWKTIHWLCFDQAGVPGFTGLLLEYAKFLDLRQPNDLAKFKAVNLILFIVLLWTRGLHWVYLISQVILSLYHDEAWMVLIIATPVLLAYTFLVNFFFIVMMFKRLVKFRNVSAEYQNLFPKDAPKMTNKSTKASLEHAAMEMELLVLDEADNFDPGTV